MFKIVFVLFLSLVFIKAEVPLLINYPGKLAEKNGNPVTGNKNIKFAFFDSENAGTEKWSGTYFVSASKGIFNVLLGSGSSIFPLSFDFNLNYWLEMTVEGEVLTPRQRISSVAYAIRSEFANRADTPMVISGCGDIDENVSEKVYFMLDKTPRSIKLYLFGEKFNPQHYTELAGHNHDGLTAAESNGHTHTVNHKHTLSCEWGGITRVNGGDNGVPNYNNLVIQNANPTSSDISAGHTHTYTTSLTGVVAQAISSSQKTYLNDLKVYRNGENISDEITSTIAGRSGLTKLGDGNAGHSLNSATGTGAVNITDLITSTGQQYLVFKQNGVNQGGRIRYYIYVYY